MKKNLWIGILGGAALGAAAGYLLTNRGNIGRGLKNVAESAMDTLGLGEEEEHEINAARQKRTNPTSRRG